MFELKKIIRPNIKSLKAYTSARDEFCGSEGVFMDANENPYGLHNRYPDPYQKELKAKISQLKNIGQNQIFLGNGSDEVIDLCFRVFCEPGISKALSFTPTYGMYEVSAVINDIEMINLKLDPDFQINLNNLMPHLTDKNLRLIFICSPNNPTANIMEIQSIEKILKSFNGILIVDEAYVDFSDSSSWIDRLTEFPNLIITQTFSKAWGMASARVGIAFASEQIISFLNKIKPPYNISTANQDLVIEGLKNHQNAKKNIDLIINERNHMMNELKKIPIIKKVHPSDANFLLIEVDDANKIYRQLLDKKIIVRNRNAIISRCLRITIGSSSENKKLIDSLKNL